MEKNLQSKTDQFSKLLIETMFRVQAGECVAITADSGSNKQIVKAIERAAQNAGGKSLVLWVPTAEYDGQAGMKVWPAPALTAALCEVDIWIDAQSVVMLYSDIWETAMAKNKKLRYLVIGKTETESLMRTFSSFDIQTLKSLLLKIQQMVMASKQVRISSNNGTDVSYEIELKYAFDFDDGDYSKPKFGTAPGYVNIVPKKASMNGRIVFDELMIVNIEDGDYVEFLMEKGNIVEIKGNKKADKFKKYLSSFNDPNMYKISHNMLGLNPGVQKLSGDIVEDERIWGGVDFGFGYTSPMDMPPDGQEAKSHFDGVVVEVTIFLDNVEIIRNGEICHPDLMPLAAKLIKN